MLQNLFSVEGKSALVTGGAKGLGAMIAEGLCAAGAKVYISSRSADDCENFAKKMRENENNCTALPADLTDMQQLEDLIANLGKHEEKLDILINNSGVSWGAPLGQFPEKGWDKVMDLNVKGLFFLTQGLLPMLQAAGSPENPSRVVNISSIAGTMPHSLSAYSYGASKAAVNQLTKNLASDLVRQYINVNAIAPGFFKTNMTAHYEDEQMLKFIPMKRFGQAEDIVGLTLFLCSKAGNYMTGNSIALDGGIMVG